MVVDGGTIVVVVVVATVVGGPDAGRVLPGVRDGGRCVFTVVVVRAGTVVVVVVDVEVVVVDVGAVVDEVVVDVVFAGAFVDGGTAVVATIVATFAAGGFGMRVPEIAPPRRTPTEHRPASATRPTHPRRARDRLCFARSSIPVSIDASMPDVSRFQPSLVNRA